MSGHYDIRDLFELFETPPGVTPLACPNPDECSELHNEANPSTGEEHHYGCECGWCMYQMWLLKR